jgi:SHS2 domain-containing protein
MTGDLRNGVSDAGWEQFDVDADVGVRAWGPTRAEAFAQAALGVFALIVVPDEVEERERREVRAQAESPETLLVSWLNECLYVHEIEGFVVRRVAVLASSDTIVHGVLYGEVLDTRRHRPGTVVKAVTLHRVSVAERDGSHQVSVIVDV